MKGAFSSLSLALSIAKDAFQLATEERKKMTKEVSFFSPSSQISHPAIQRDLLSLEKQEGAMNFKFGVIFAKAGQILDDELFSNENGSEAFNNFLEDVLGEKVKLKGWNRYKGGLDVNSDQTGLESVFTEFEGHEVMFHVSTLLPFHADDPQQVKKNQLNFFFFEFAKRGQKLFPSCCQELERKKYGKEKVFVRKKIKRGKNQVDAQSKRVFRLFVCLATFGKSTAHKLCRENFFPPSEMLKNEEINNSFLGFCKWGSEEASYFRPHSNFRKQKKREQQQNKAFVCLRSLAASKNKGQTTTFYKRSSSFFV